MATSNSYNFNENVYQVILDALQLIGVQGIGRSVDIEDINFCYNAINKMVKAWGTMGLHLWAKSEGVVYLGQYTAQYTLGNTVSDANVANVSDQVIAQISGNYSAGTTLLNINSTAGMVMGDYIGVVLSDLTTQWSTISLVNSSTSVTLTNPLTLGVNDSALVFSYSTKIYKPLRIISARLVSGIDLGATSSRIERVLYIADHKTYFEMPAKDTNGQPTQIHYNPILADGNLYVWPRPLDTSYRIEFTYERIIQDLDEATDDFDFPPEWLEALTYQLALRIAPGFGKEDKASKTIAPLAMDSLTNLKNWDVEVNCVQMSPDLGYSY